MFWNKPKPKNHLLGVKSGRKPFNQRLLEDIPKQRMIINDLFSTRKLVVFMLSPCLTVDEAELDLISNNAATNLHTQNVGARIQFRPENKSC